MVRKIKNQTIGIQTNFPLDVNKENQIMMNLKFELHQKYGIKKYSEIEKIKEISRFLYDNLFSKLEPIIKSNSNYEFLEKLTKEYGKAFHVLSNNSKEEKVKFYGRQIKLAEYREQVYRRILKYIIEQVAYNIEKYGETVSEIDYEELFVYTEEALNISGHSYSIDVFNTFEFSINPNENIDFFTFDVNNDFVEKFPLKKFINDENYYNHGSPIPLNNQRVKEKLNEFCLKEFDVDYKKLLDFFNLLFKISLKNPSNFVIKRDKVIKKISVKSKLSSESVDQIINKLSINAEDINNQLYNPKRKNRIYRKLFIKIKDKLIFSPYFIKEGECMFFSSVYFNKFETSIEKRKYVSRVNTEVGKSFENFVKNKFIKNNYTTFKSIEEYKDSKGRIVDLEINGGEVDIIAFNNCLNKCYFIECKMLEFSTEPKHYFDDKDKFFRKNGYNKKFQNKINYFEKNKGEILEYLSKEKKVELDIDKLEIENKLLIFYPSPLEDIIDEKIFGFSVENAYLFFENSIKK